MSTKIRLDLQATPLRKQALRQCPLTKPPDPVTEVKALLQSHLNHLVCLNAMKIRQATEDDFEAIWPIFREITSAGETYAYPRTTSKKEAHRLWMQVPRKTYVAEENGQIVGTYYLKTNQGGPGSHVCNCGYMVPAVARGRGVATAMCRHSQTAAIELGYKAMQFNLVVATNEGAVRLWRKLGFEIAGRLPGAFQHPARGFVDALVMYKWLNQEQVD